LKISRSHNDRGACESPPHQQHLGEISHETENDNCRTGAVDDQWGGKRFYHGTRVRKGVGPEGAQAKQVPQSDITCVFLTHEFLVNLEGATKAKVIKAMKANGRLVNTHLHFITVYTGVVDFTFENDKVVIIQGWGMEGAGANEFIWNNQEQEIFACSDLPGSDYDRCNRAK
jgi:hypothetical protein